MERVMSFVPRIEHRRFYAQLLMGLFVILGFLFFAITTESPIQAQQLTPVSQTQEPSMEASLDKIDVMLFPNTAMSFSIVITNTGDVPLEWSLIDQRAVEWLAINSQTANIPIWSNPQDIHTMTIQVGPHPVPGTYTTTLGIDISGETILLQDVIIPVTLTVKSRQIFLPLVVRNYPPMPKISSVHIYNLQGDDKFTYQTPVTVSVTADIVSDTIRSVGFSNDNQDWTWKDWDASGDFAWMLNNVNGLQSVYVKVKGAAGGISTVAFDSILLFNNGDFSQGLGGWQQGGELPRSIGTNPAMHPGEPDNPVGVLGPDGPGRDAAIGYARLWQTFQVPIGQPVWLKFRYHIYTYDRNIGLTPQYDRFDVLFNGQLVHADANQGSFDGQTLYNLGVVEKSILVPQNLGNTIQVEFRVSNLPDELYKTYVYLDDVHLAFTTQ